MLPDLDLLGSIQLGGAIQHHFDAGIWGNDSGGVEVWNPTLLAGFTQTPESKVTWNVGSEVIGAQGFDPSQICTLVDHLDESIGL